MSKQATATATAQAPAIVSTDHHSMIEALGLCANITALVIQDGTDYALANSAFSENANMYIELQQAYLDDVQAMPFHIERVTAYENAKNALEANDDKAAIDTLKLAIIEAKKKLDSLNRFCRRASYAVINILHTGTVPADSNKVETVGLSIVETAGADGSFVKGYKPSSRAKGRLKEAGISPATGKPFNDAESKAYKAEMQAKQDEQENADADVVNIETARKAHEQQASRTNKAIQAFISAYNKAEGKRTQLEKKAFSILNGLNIQTKI